ncbi:MAG TPA: MotA/TolQ/ExbB proton channel family protein [Solirubrobacterales bacterium]|nr:MotA/TolQ/ExbB proton channel family protein [Solirubrobacterales bacterium]
MNVEQLLFEVSEALRVPVLILALVALAVALVEAGALAMELWRRRGRSLWALDHAIAECQGRLAAGMQAQAVAALLPVARNPAMEEVLSDLVAQQGGPSSEARVAKLLAEYDYRSLRKLERTRILVRMGPALGLMGTLIPLSPALAGLADGDVATLTENLRVAFGVTVAGLLVGAVAFSISLVRDRLYAQDYSDVEYVAARLSSPPASNGAPAGHSHWAVAP